MASLDPLGRHAGSGPLDDADKVVTRGERQRPLEVCVSARPDEGIGEAGAGSEHLDADLIARFGGPDVLELAEQPTTPHPGPNVLPRHAANIAEGDTACRKYTSALGQSPDVPATHRVGRLMP